MPPEYCMHDKKDYSECKNWLQGAHPQLYNKIYGEPTEGQEEEKKEGEGKAKKKKKVGIQMTEGGEIKIIKAKRGQKKTICTVLGLQNYGVNLKDAAKAMGKKFACGASVAEDDKYGECIQIQGDISDRFEEFVNAELAKYNINIAENLKVEEVKKKKKAEG